MLLTNFKGHLQTQIKYYNEEAGSHKTETNTNNLIVIRIKWEAIDNLYLNVSALYKIWKIKWSETKLI